MRRLLLVAPLMVTLLVLPGCKVMQRISDGSYDTAVTDGVVAELADRGIRLEHRPACKMQDSGTSVVSIRCTATTSTGEPVAVRGVARDANTKHPRETYVVTIGGREVLRKDCLGLGCH